MTISENALLAFTTMEKCTAWINKAASGIIFLIGSLPFEQAVDVADEQQMPLYLDVDYDARFMCYQNQRLSARMLVDPKVVAELEVAKARPNDPCPCGSGKKYKKCCGRG